MHCSGMVLFAVWHGCRGVKTIGAHRRAARCGMSGRFPGAWLWRAMRPVRITGGHREYRIMIGDVVSQNGPGMIFGMLSPRVASGKRGSHPTRASSFPAGTVSRPSLRPPPTARPAPLKSCHGHFTSAPQTHRTEISCPPVRARPRDGIAPRRTVCAGGECLHSCRHWR